MQSGDRIVFRTAGGGGWGDALEREPDKIRRDVVRGLLTGPAAESEYGVVLSGPRFEVDAAATENLRDSLRKKRKVPALFDFGKPAWETGQNTNSAG